MRGGTARSSLMTPVSGTDPQTRTFVMQAPTKLDHLVLCSPKMRNLAVDLFSRTARFRSSDCRGGDEPLAQPDLFERVDELLVLGQFGLSACSLPRVPATTLWLSPDEAHGSRVLHPDCSDRDLRPRGTVPDADPVRRRVRRVVAVDVQGRADRGVVAGHRPARARRARRSRASWGSVRQAATVCP